MENKLLYQIFETVKEKRSSGEDIIELNLGEPQARPPQKAIEKARNSLEKGRFKYGPAVGERNLREQISREHKVSKENVIVGTGSKFLIYSFLKSIIKKSDDEIIIPQPSWGAFSLMVEEIGMGKVKYLNTKYENKWRFTIQTFEKSINKNTKCVIITNPNNPTSTVHEIEVLESIVGLARKKGFFVLIDGAYSELTFDKKKILLVNSRNLKTTAYSFTFSKKFSMAGFRLGYLIAATKKINELKRFSQSTITSVPLFIQDAGLEALEKGKSYTDKVRSIYKERVKLAVSLFKKANVGFVEPQAGFYLFLKINQDGEKFATKLLNQGVAVVPGTAFGPYKNFIRISLTESENRLIKGLNIIFQNLS